MDKKKISKYSAALSLATRFLIVNALVWLFFGISMFIRISYEDVLLASVIRVLMLINAIIFGFLAYGLAKKKVKVFYAAIIYVLINALLTLADQWGTVDASIFTLNLITLILLLASSGYFKKK